MFSRLVLAAQYGLVAFHVRKFRHGRNVITYAILLHLIPAILYMVLAVVMASHRDRSLVTAWYVIGVGEMIAVLVHATISKTLSFSGTHFNERLNLLTLIILGEGKNRRMLPYRVDLGTNDNSQVSLSCLRM